MEDRKEKVHQWFNELVPKICKSLQRESENVTYDLSVPNDSFYLSDMYRFNVKFPRTARGEEKPETLNFIVKLPQSNEVIRRVMQSDCQFHNEILFYRKFAGRLKDSVPGYVYSEEDPPNYVLVLENATTRGFDVHSQKFNVSIEYTLAAMRELAKFHGEGYVMKERNRAEFFDLVKDIQETRYDENNRQLENLVNVTTLRAVDYLRIQGHDGVFCDRMTRYLRNAFENVMKKAVEPTEPLATLCHGDATLNNILFKRENGELRGMLIDFALIRYATPAVDLSTYLYLCCSIDDLRNHFEEIFETYYGALKDYLVQARMDRAKIVSRDALLDDYKRKVLFGFAIASFFLPILMGKCALPPEKMLQMDPETSTRIFYTLGGDEMSRLFADMLLEIKDRGWLDHIS